MSTLNTTNLKNESSVTNNIVLGADGSVDLGTLEVNGAASVAPLVVSTDSTERARIDSSGRLLVGTFSSTTGANFQIETSSLNEASLRRFGANAFGSVLQLAKTRGTTPGSYTVVQNGDELGGIYFRGSDGSQDLTGASILSYVDGAPGANDLPTRLVFSTTADGVSSPTERMRIDNLGNTTNFASGIYGLTTKTSLAAGTTNALLAGVHSATSTTTGGTVSFTVYTNGNIVNTNNSYGSLSDIKLKENIVDASSQWDDLKALQVRNYNFKEGQTHTQIGLIAQEVELVSPGLVSESPDRDEDGNDLGTVTKSVNYSVLYMKAVKALQEAIERIEVLEAKVNALEGN